MSNSEWILDKIKPCDLYHPYIFISYSDADSEIVWADVLEFQRRGFNVWLDCNNLNAANESWERDAISAIQYTECRMLVFYVSADSLCSENCYKELSETLKIETQDLHCGDSVPFIAVETEPIGDITAYKQKVFKQIEDKGDELPPEERRKLKNQKRNALANIMRDFFDDKNDKVRILSKNDPKRRKDYYNELTSSFPEETRNLKAEAEAASDIAAAAETDIDTASAPDIAAVAETAAVTCSAPASETRAEAAGVNGTENTAEIVSESAADVNDRAFHRKRASIQKRLAAAHPDWSEKKLYAAACRMARDEKK
ncbi:MAG: toll/interleukin-1 receptor domain-containing protein [Lachnospiraceae bacterium]|nr:toll/interleukin-1 receptor domain-containing protein [Lachnospiraceae bacterium]